MSTLLEPTTPSEEIGSKSSDESLLEDEHRFPNQFARRTDQQLEPPSTSSTKDCTRSQEEPIDDESNEMERTIAVEAEPPTASKKRARVQHGWDSKDVRKRPSKGTRLTDKEDDIDSSISQVRFEFATLKMERCEPKPDWQEKEKKARRKKKEHRNSAEAHSL
ncbi:MAG: hypothetical protein Q9196_001757 [Gyalolechia fulgens]